MLHIAIDRGGTFTDLVAYYKGRYYFKKILSESKEYEDSNSKAIRELLKDIFGNCDSRIDLKDIGSIRLGTTVATNALLEKKGDNVTLLVTKGFKDLLEIGYQDRDELFALKIEKPKPLYDEVLEVDERVLFKDGEFIVKKPLRALPKVKNKNIAVAFMHSYGFFEHEKRAKELLKYVNVSLSSEIMPDVKIVDRATTAVVDAYLSNIVKKYVKNILKNFEGDIDKKIFFIKSDGGLCKADEFRGANSLLSGPAGGVVALANIYRDKALIGFDMGGTSTDVSRYDGKVELKYRQKIANSYINYPSVDIYTVASGGGSRLFLKDGMLFVGPQSSGSNPGPLCYGRDGYLSVTDANLVTKRLDINSIEPIFGKNYNEPLNYKASYNGFVEMAKELNLSVEALAEAFLDVANENMANAIKEITIKKGFKPSEHILCSFGGAGGQHAIGVARKLGIKQIYIDRFSGIFSALGILNATVSKEFVKVIDKVLEQLDLNRLFNEFYDDKKIDGFSVKRFLFLKYKGTDTALEIEYKEGFLEEFYKKYKQIFSFNLDADVVVEKILLRFTSPKKSFKKEKIKEQKMLPYKSESIFLNGRWQEAKIYKEIFANNQIEGPALILQDSSTILLDEKSIAKVDDFGNIEIFLDELEQKSYLEEARVSLLQNRLTFIAKKMGDILQRSAISVNIKNRADFSCAIFDKNGDLIVNAPHIPVHLGSMSSVVKFISKNFKITNEDSFITNAPYEGGSHLPDITVVTPGFIDGELKFWVASRGHQADIGGDTAGSMPPFSRYLSQEGAIIEAFRVVEDGKFKEQKLREILKDAKARKIDDNISDIKAQIAANFEGLRSVKELNLDELEWFFRRIKAISSKKMQKFLENFKNRRLLARDFLDNGAKIELEIYFKDNKSIFDFSNSSIQLLSNQNAPFAVLKSAILYSLRVMLNEDVPLNEGLLEGIEIIAPKGSLLNPDKELAIVGGNVTTSQRVVDVILSAFGIAANSCGCMNNLLFGDESFGYYETIGGGSGASIKGDGASGVHTHMTNTKITDSEVLERNYPVIVKEFSIRENSGGDGKYKGGDGLIRELEFLKELEVSILSERRVFEPNGIKGGKNGAKGENYLIRDGKKYYLGSKASFKCKKGDIVLIKTPGGGGYGEN